MATIDMSKLPRIIDGGKWDTGHVQGITVDTAHEYIYFSFTTKLIKTDMQGRWQQRLQSLCCSPLLQR